jgi:hypothetical protein
MIQVGDAIWQRPQWRGLVQGAMRPVGVVKVLIFPQHHHQVAQAGQRTVAGPRGPVLPCRSRARPGIFGGGVKDGRADRISRV